MQIEEFETLIREKYLAENEIIQKGYDVKDYHLLIITNKRIFNLDCSTQFLHFLVLKHAYFLGLYPAQGRGAFTQILVKTGSEVDSMLFYQESEAQEAFQLIAKNMPL